MIRPLRYFTIEFALVFVTAVKIISYLIIIIINYHSTHLSVIFHHFICQLFRCFKAMFTLTMINILAVQFKSRLLLYQLSLQVVVDGEEWIVLAIDMYDYSIF